MGSKKALTLKQERFVHEYLIDLNATQAAIRSGYSKKTAKQIGSQNLSKLDISAAIQAAANERIDRIKIDADYVLAGAKEMFERCMQHEQIMEKVDGKWISTGEWKFDSSGAAKALRLIGEHISVNAFKHVGNDEMPIDTNWTVTIVHSTKEGLDEREKCLEHST